MPTYDYKCSNCGETFEKFQSITAAPIRKCPKCGKNTAKRLIGIGAGLIFKGSGFYITDYRSDSYKDAAKSDAPKAEAASSDGAKSDAPKTDGSKSAEGASSQAKSGTGDAPKTETKAPTKSEPAPVSKTSSARASSKPSKKKR